MRRKPRQERFGICLHRVCTRTFSVSYHNRLCARMSHICRECICPTLLTICLSEALLPRVLLGSLSPFHRTLVLRLWPYLPWVAWSASELGLWREHESCLRPCGAVSGSVSPQRRRWRRIFDL